MELEDELGLAYHDGSTYCDGTQSLVFG